MSLKSFRSWPFRKNNRGEADIREKLKDLPQTEVLHMHEHLTQLYINEDRLLSERTNLFLLASSFLFTAFGALVYFEVPVLPVVLPWAGICLCTLHHSSASATWFTLRFWEKCISMIEENETFRDLRELDLTPFSASRKFWEGKETLQTRLKEPGRELKRMGTFKRWLYFKRFGPAQITRYWLPGVFIALWLLSFFVALNVI